MCQASGRASGMGWGALGGEGRGRNVGSITRFDDFAELDDAAIGDLANRHGFFRSGANDVELPLASDGPPYTSDQARRVAHAFLAALAQGRPLKADYADPCEHAVKNGLLVLFSDDVVDVFLGHVAKMPEPEAARWREILAGGTSSEAFGPLTLEEQLDERQVEQALVDARKQQRANRLVGFGVAGVVVVGAWFGLSLLDNDEQRTAGALQFASADDTIARVDGPTPEAVSELTAVVDQPVAVVAGPGPVENRVVDASDAPLPVEPGELAASVFELGGEAQIAVVGPAGFADAVCLRVSVVTAELRPLDTVTTASCADPVGRVAEMVCVGDTAIVFGVSIAPGMIELPEGGTGFADAVRVQSITEEAEGFDLVAVRAVVSVDPESDVVIPSFGGTFGDELEFVLTGDHAGTCSLVEGG